jgi:hypothetical protein
MGGGRRAARDPGVILPCRSAAVPGSAKMPAMKRPRHGQTGESIDMDDIETMGARPGAAS